MSNLNKIKLMRKIYMVGEHRAPVKSAYWKTILFISHTKHMFKLMGKKIITILRS